MVWYAREFEIAAEGRPARLILHFGAVDYRASVWVNGRLAVEHEGGHTPFFADIAPLLPEGGRQIVVVRAEDDPGDLRQPRGKQGWRAEPESIWYHRTTGIWQPVWLEPLGALSIAELRWTPDLDRLGVGMTLWLNRRPTRPVRSASSSPATIPRASWPRTSTASTPPSARRVRGAGAARPLRVRNGRAGDSGRRLLPDSRPVRQAQSRRMIAAFEGDRE